MSDKFPPVYPVPIIELGKYKCSACEAVFNHEEDVKNHIKIAHPEETEPELAEKLVMGPEFIGYESKKNTKIDKV